MSYYITRSKFPTITGLIIIGLLVSATSFIKRYLLNYQDFVALVIEITPVLLVFRAGLELTHVRSFTKKILIASIIQSLITYLVIFLITKFVMELNNIESLVMGTIWMVTGTDVSITIIKNLKIAQDLKEKLASCTIIDDLIAEIFFFLSFPLLHFSSDLQGKTSQIFFLSLQEVVLSILLGFFLGIALSLFIKLTKLRFIKFTTAFSIIILLIGISSILKTHSLIVSLLAGTVISIMIKKEYVFSILNSLREFENIFYTLFVIVIIGSVTIFNLEKSLYLGLVTLIIRFIGKSIGAFAIEQTKLLDDATFLDIVVSLAPQSILSLYFAYKIKDLVTRTNLEVLPITIAGVIIFEIFGYLIIYKLELNKEN
ncbi:MAG: cation:proton antiporter [Caldisericaceae bacterium]